jgi:NAD(P)-dependent dehydrogenase (short-subunit alcohol dehydrogenase family)
MSKTIIVAGYGPGISSAVAERFGKEGFSVALVARNEDKLQSGVQSLKARGIAASAFPADLSDPASIDELVAAVRSKLGPISVLHWNAYAGLAGDFLSAKPAEIRSVIDLPVVGLVAALQASLADLRSQKDSALLVTNGGLGLYDPQVDALAVEWGAQGLAVANAAKHKLVGLLSNRLKGDGVYVGEVIVLSLVKGTPFDNGSATLEPSRVADKFWELYRQRSEVSVTIA